MNHKDALNFILANSMAIVLDGCYREFVVRIEFNTFLVRANYFESKGYEILEVKEIGNE